MNDKESFVCLGALLNQNVLQGIANHFDKRTSIDILSSEIHLGFDA